MIFLSYKNLIQKVSHSDCDMDQPSPLDPKSTEIPKENVESDDILEQISIKTLVLAETEGGSGKLRTQIIALTKMAKRYRELAVDSTTKHQALILETLAQEKRAFVESFKSYCTESQTHMNEMSKMVEVEAISREITVPLTRLLPNHMISQCRSGYVCLPLPPLGEEGYEVVVFVEFVKDREIVTFNNGFRVYHDVDGLHLDGWPDEGKICANIQEVADSCLSLMAILPEPALAFLRLHDPQ